MKKNRFSRWPTTQLFPLCVLVLAVSGWDLAAETFAVMNVNDSGLGSFRQAINDANANPGPDRIEFNIPPPGPYSIKVFSQLPFITDPVVIDATTQPGFVGTPIVELSGALAGLNVSGILLLTSNSTVKGFVINSFSNGSGIEIHAGNNVIEGNYIGLDRTGTRALGNTYDGILVQSASSNRIGGVTAASRNVISGNTLSGVELHFGRGNLVQGNYIGTDVFGTNQLGNINPGVYISFSSGNIIGGASPGAGNVISGNSYAGIYIDGSSSTGNLVAGNFIGTDAQGLRTIPNQVAGVALDDAAGNNTIGGANPGSRNVISGNTSEGVRIIGNSAGNRVQGNYIGVDGVGVSPLSNALSGVLILGGFNNTVGGTNAGTPNVIAFNGAAGVAVKSGTGNAIQGNDIFSNAALGIELGATGVTTNDVGDVDFGPNNLQNFPGLTSVTNNGTNTIIQGSLNAASNTTFVIEFFANDAPDISGYGQGQFFLGSSNVVTGSNSNATFTVSLPTNVAVSQFISATATDPAGNTSEFSAVLPVGPPVLKFGRFGPSMVLSWSRAFSGFHLEKAPDLAANGWLSVTPAPAIVNGAYTVTNSLLSATNFYHLKKP